MYFFVTRLVRWNQHSTLRAFCDVSIDKQLLIKGIRIVDGRHGPFVSMPRHKTAEDTWRDIVVPLTHETKTELSRIILEAFQNVQHANGGGHNGK